MKDLPPLANGAPAGNSLWLSIKKALARIQDWFAVQSIGVKLAIAAVAVDNHEIARRQRSHNFAGEVAQERRHPANRQGQRARSPRVFAR